MRRITLSRLATLLGLGLGLVGSSVCAQTTPAAAPAASASATFDGVEISLADKAPQFLPGNQVLMTLRLSSRTQQPQQGELFIQARDLALGRTVLASQQRLQIALGAGSEVEVTLPSRAGMQLRLRYVDASSGAERSASWVAPYLLTPPDGPAPAFHGARLLGARPGSQLHHRVAATGTPPLRFSAQGLPKGLVLDAGSGVISGVVPPAGRYAVQLRASNAAGSASLGWTLVSGEQLALTPPMGWNGWNAFGPRISDALVRQQAQALIDQGLAAKGYQTVFVDDGWQASARSPDGRLGGNAAFPDMPALGAFLHEHGLRFGLYASPGPHSCSRLPGSFGHEAQDLASWVSWGVDHLRYDLCSYREKMPAQANVADHQKPFALMGQLLKKQPRSIVYQLVQYGQERVWAWGPDVGAQLWRSGGDLGDSWPELLASGFTLSNLAGFVGPGRFNDPDMLVVGRVGWGEARFSRLSPDQQYSHISLWALLAAPLVLGNDLGALDEFTRNLVGNSEVIAVNQDPLARAAQRVLERNGWQVWVKPLEGGALAVGVFNGGESFGRFELDPATLGLGGQSLKLRDIWRQRDWGTQQGPFQLALPAHGVALLLVR